MNLYQRHAVTRVTAVCAMVIVATAFFAEKSVAASISGNPPTTVEVGETYRFNPTVSGLRASTVRFSITGRPGWIAFNPSTGQLTGRPGKYAVRQFKNITIRVTDGLKSATLSPFTLTVKPASGGGSGASINPDDKVAVGEQYYFKPSVSGFQPGTLRFATRKKPSWLNFDKKTGVLSGTPKSGDVGSYGRIVVRATDGDRNTWIGPFSIKVTASSGNPPPPGGGNTRPTVSGSPPSSVLEGSSFSFTPSADDADGDNLSFSVAGLPNWAQFNSSSGRLWGTPNGSDVGIHGGISITVSDGKSSASLGPFSIRVNSRGDTSLTLQWTPPTRNTDGSVLRDLAGYRIDWGRVPGGFTDSVTVNNAGLTSYVVESLTPGEYKFTVYAVNSAGVVSERSNVSRRTIN